MKHDRDTPQPTSIPAADEFSETEPFQRNLHEARLLLVDDDPVNNIVLQDMLEENGFRNIRTTINPLEVADLFREFEPDLMVLDLMMPVLDGIGVMEQLQEEYGGRIPVPVLVLTADITPQAKRKALAKGARDFLTKPFDAVEFQLRVSNLLENRFLYRNLEKQNATLEDRVSLRTAELEGARRRISDYARELEEAHLETLVCLARAGEFRDDETGQHTIRVAHTTAQLAVLMGFDEERVGWIQQAARLHDVGKIGISDTILLKPGKLTDEEFATMKTHTTIGAQVLEHGRSDLMQIAQRIAQSHHERWDGNGYPQRLKGEEIPIEARLLAVADVFDALTHDRPYKKAWPIDEAVAEISNQSGRQFDPAVVEKFLMLDHAALV